MPAGIFQAHRGFWSRERTQSLSVGILLLIVALAIQMIAGRYSAKAATNFVGDIFLDNLPTVNLNYIIVDGGFLVILASTIILTVRPRYLLFSLKAASTFIVIRSFFVSVTHLGIYPEQIVLGSGAVDRFYALFNLQDGFFFSAHTGLPLLMAFIFWDNPLLRYFFIVLSMFFGASVLFAHVHYSIDVFAAPFMTYAIFKISQKIFPKDYGLIPK